MDLEKVLFDKDNFIFKRIKQNHYKLDFSIKNEEIYLSKIINFDLLNIIYDLNPDIYEKIKIFKINENEIEACLLMKHIFKDLGLPQKFSFFNMKRVVEENLIVFNSQSIKNIRPQDIPLNAKLVDISNLNIICNIITPHNIQFSANIMFNPLMNIQPFVEKTVGIIIYKIFKRVKQFIENIRI